MQKPKFVQDITTYKILWDFEIEMDHLIPTKRFLVLISKKKGTSYLEDFSVPVDHKVKMKESEKINKYLNLAKELKKLWNKVTVVPITDGALGKVLKIWKKKQEELEIRERAETIVKIVKIDENIQMSSEDLSLRN